MESRYYLMEQELTKCHKRYFIADVVLNDLTVVNLIFRIAELEMYTQFEYSGIRAYNETSSFQHIPLNIGLPQGTHCIALS